MALADNALIDFTFVQSINNADNTEQEYYETLINAASNYADFKVGYRLKMNDYTGYFETHYGSTKITLPETPVNFIDVFQIDAEHTFDTGTEVQPSEYDLDEAAGIIHLLHRYLPGGRKTAYVEYNAGYDPIPADLQYATYEVIQWMRDKGIQSIGRKTYVGADGADVGFEMTPPVSAQIVFENYWRPY